MSDLRLLWAATAADLVLAAGDLETDDGLETALIVSLFTDRRAADGDALPSPSADRRGWWGDHAQPPVDGDRVGSRLWLLAREKQLPVVLDRAVAYAREALQWLIDDRVATRVEVEAEFTRPGLLGLLVVIERPQMPPLEVRYQYAWQAQAERVA